MVRFTRISFSIGTAFTGNPDFAASFSRRGPFTPPEVTIASVFAPKECSTREAFMPRPPAESPRERIYARSSKTSLSTAMFRSTEGLIVTVSINTQCYPETLPRNPHFQAYLALAAVCIFWGTTYLGIRIAIESMQPQVLMALRYTISGLILLIAAYFMGAHLPT